MIGSRRPRLPSGVVDFSGQFLSSPDTHLPCRNCPLRVVLRRPEIFIQLCNCLGGVRERIVEMPFDLRAEPPGHVGQQVRQFVPAGDRRRQLVCGLLDERLLVLVSETALRARGIKLGDKAVSSAFPPEDFDTGILHVGCERFALAFQLACLGDVLASGLCLPMGGANPVRYRSASIATIAPVMLATGPMPRFTRGNSAS